MITFHYIFVDNFYLDMNGIIHNCTHSNQGVVTSNSETIMFSKIFDYINSLFQIARPQKLMYMAIDGANSFIFIYPSFLIPMGYWM